MTVKPNRSVQLPFCDLTAIKCCPHIWMRKSTRNKLYWIQILLLNELPFPFSRLSYSPVFWGLNFFYAAVDASEFHTDYQEGDLSLFKHSCSQLFYVQQYHQWHRSSPSATQLKLSLSCIRSCHWLILFLLYAAFSRTERTLQEGNVPGCGQIVWGTGQWVFLMSLLWVAAMWEGSWGMKKKKDLKLFWFL